MPRKKLAFRSTCPISTALDILGDKWSLLIVRDMAFNGMSTYGDFLKGGENIATNILADRLLQLEAAGILTKQPHPESGSKNLYKLTQKGIDLVPALVEIVLWSERYHEVHPRAQQFAAHVRLDKQAAVNQLMAGLKNLGQ